MVPPADIVLVGCGVVVATELLPEPIIDESTWTNVARRKVSTMVEIMTDSAVCPVRPIIL